MRTSTLEMRLRVPLDRFDLDVDCVTQNRVVGLYGASGSGKTTWLESVAGLRRRATGRLSCGDAVWLDSERAINLPPEERGIGYVPQDQRLFPHLNVRQNLLFAANRRKAFDWQGQSTFREVTEVLELQPLLDRRTDHLSGGERQRVALGRALCSAPRLLMLDEPLASLDMDLRHRILPFLKRVREHFDVPMLIVSHQPLELQALCDEVFALRLGKLIARGKPIDVFTNSAIYKTATREGFENILTAVLASTGDATSILKFGGEGETELVTLPVKRSVGDEVILGIPAQDILIADHRIEGISARNVLPATITSLREAEGRLLVFALVEGQTSEPLLVEVTADAINELKLEAGRSVFLLIKTSSIHIYENGRD